MKSALLAGVLAVALAACAGTAAVPAPAPAPPPAGESAVVTTLYLGRSIRGGGDVSDADARRFLDEVAVPALPDGFTVLRGEGWWRGDAAAAAREDTLVLVVVHDGGAERDAALRRVADAWRTRFRQESVLRTDAPARAAW